MATISKLKVYQNNNWETYKFAVAISNIFSEHQGGYSENKYLYFPANSTQAGLISASSINGTNPKAHASTNKTTYGAANTGNYGHVKTVNSSGSSFDTEDTALVPTTNFVTNYFRSYNPMSYFALNQTADATAYPRAAIRRSGAGTSASPNKLVAAYEQSDNNISLLTLIDQNGQFLPDLNFSLVTIPVEGFTPLDGFPSTFGTEWGSSLDIPIQNNLYPFAITGYSLTTMNSSATIKSGWFSIKQILLTTESGVSDRRKLQIKLSNHRDTAISDSDYTNNIRVNVIVLFITTSALNKWRIS